MLKSKFKVLLCVVFALMLVTSYCFATEEPAVATSEPEIPSEAVEQLISSDDSSDGQAVSEDQQATTTDDMISNDLYTIDSTVNVTKVVDGNAYIIGQNVTISKEIGGDVYVIADKLTITNTAYIYSNLYAIANEINIEGVVYDVYAMTNKFTLAENAYIYRDLRLASSNVNISGQIRRNAYISSNNITFPEDSEALIGGNLNYYSTSDLSISNDIAAGEVVFNQQAATSSNSALGKILTLVMGLLLTLIITILLVWLAPKYVERLGNMNSGRAFSALGIGFLTPIAVFILSFILIFSIIGIPVFVFLVIASVLLAIVSNTVANIFFAKLLVNKFKMQGNVKLVLFTLLVDLVISIIALIPVIGAIITFLVGIFGLGLTLMNINWKKEKIKQAE